MARIDSLRIYNFRNIEEAVVKIQSPFVCFYGQNAQGKTNILEAIYLMSNVRSFRSGSVPDWIQKGKEESSVMAEVDDDLGSYKAGFKLKNGKREFLINEKQTEGIKSIIKRLRIISYNPSSYELILGDDGERRRFFDRVVYSIDTDHLDDVIYYNRVLKNRNTALKQKQDYRLWDDFIANTGERIISRRIKAMELMQDYFTDTFHLFFNDSSNVVLKYRPSAGTSKEEILKRLGTDVRIDEFKGATGSGPHRDRIDIIFNDSDAKRVVSTGQAKLIAFLFKVAKTRFIKEFSKKSPIFLYDDVSAFLDEKRLLQLIDIIKKEDVQIVSTSVDNNLFRKLFSDSVQFITVREGSVING
ncbi:MAG: DNA replication and repair protein RecF [Proteobacteria bacterium]|nr:DNA replication and repair protein RecF [Pseudomonadota bacterium]